MIYLLQVNLGIILFYALYKLVCTRDTLFNSRRLILMLALILPFIIPLIDIREWMETRDSLVMLTNFDYSTTIPEIVVGTAGTEAGTEPGNQVFVISEWIKNIYIAGILALSVRLIVQAISLYLIILRTPEKTVNGIRIKCMKDKSGPFSFFNWIFLNPDNVKEEEMSEILTHEMAHVRQKCERRGNERNSHSRNGSCPPETFHRCDYLRTGKYMLLDKSIRMADETRSETES